MKINDEIIELSIDEITPHEGSHNTDAVVSMLQESINQYGITQPISVDKNYVIVTGNALYKAAKLNGLKTLPCVVLDYLTDDEIAQYRIADNKTSEFARWNEGKLKKELSYLTSPTSLQFCFDESINNMLGFTPPVAIQKQPKKEEVVSREEKERIFKVSLNEIEKSMEVKPRQYMTYVCSKCKKEVTIKL